MYFSVGSQKNSLMNTDIWRYRLCYSTLTGGFMFFVPCSALLEIIDISELVLLPLVLRIGLLLHGTGCIPGLWIRERSPDIEASCKKISHEQVAWRCSSSSVDVEGMGIVFWKGFANKLHLQSQLLFAQLNDFRKYSCILPK